MASKRCAACRREAPASVLAPVRSVLDSEMRELCPACIENKAEALAALVRTVNRAGWGDQPDSVRRSIRVWDMDAYVPVPVWADRMRRQQLVDPVTTSAASSQLDNEDEALLRRVRRKRQELTKPAASQQDDVKSKNKRPQKFKTWLSI